MIDWDHHLEKTSRTFALSIPLLDEPLRREVTLAYLLFRVADTLEDAAAWTASQRSECLLECAAVVRNGDEHQALRASRRWLELGPSEHAGYLALLEAFPALLRDTRSLRPASVERVEHHLLRTIERMDTFLRGADDDGAVVLRSRADLESYCYAVAGIVGELLTDLFVLHTPALNPSATALLRDAPAFGEGLQLVNIARDAGDDAQEGRAFIPPGMTPADVLAMAHADLDRAERYIALLREGGAPAGTVSFVALPVALARATLQRVRLEGAGAKLSRAEVATLMHEITVQR